MLTSSLTSAAKLTPRFASAAAPLAPPAHPRIVAIGGGTGLPTVLRGIREASEAVTGSDRTDWLTAIVTVMDDGGSSGRLRQALGVLPPGDIRNCLAALVRNPSPLSRILSDRLPSENGEAGHAVGNLLLAALSSTEPDFSRAIGALASLIDVSGRVLPATHESVHLRASFDDGGDVRGETAIAARRGRIRRLSLERPVTAAPDVLDALSGADLIVVGPGSLYTSILPNLLVDGVAEAIAGARATCVYVANLMTEPGETDGYSLADHLAAIREHTARDLFDYVLVNCAPLDAAALARYAADGAQMVSADDAIPGVRARVVSARLAERTPDGQIRHHPAALGFALAALAAL